MKLPTVQSGSGPRFGRHTGVVAPLPLPNLDCGIIASTGPDSATGISAGQGAFEALRYLPDGSEDSAFVLNSEPYRRATILLAGANFGVGENPASAVGRLAASGIRVVIAPSFGPEFVGAGVAFGLLSVTLAPAVIEEFGEWVDLNPGVEITIDLEAQQIECVDREPIPLDMHPRLRNKLLFGLSELDEMLEHHARTSAFRQADRVRRPWLYNWREPSDAQAIPLEPFDDEGDGSEA